MIRVLVVDETPVLCRVTAAAIESDPEIHVVGCATTVDEALAQILRYNLVLVSATLADDGALELIRTVSKTAPWIKVLAIGTAELKEHLLACIQNGAAGYVLREGSVEQLLQSIRLARSSTTVVTPETLPTTRRLFRDMAWMNWETEADTHCATDLTSYERRVLHLVRRGLRHQEIADYLNIDRTQARHHVHSILRKLNNNLVLHSILMQTSKTGGVHLGA